MKNGLIHEQDHLVYYKNDRLYHAGVIKVDGDIYYIGSKGRAVKGVHVVHGEMANGILKRGTYTFGEDYKLIPDSYVAPRKRKKKPFRNLKRKMKKCKKWLPSVALSALMVFIIFLVVTMPDQIAPDGTTTNAGRDVKIEEKVQLPIDGTKVLLCSSAAQKMYYNEMSIADAVDAGMAYRPCTFPYDLLGDDGTLRLWEQDDPSKVRAIELPANRTSVTIDNLKTGEVYEYEVSVRDEVYTGSFETERSNRFISIPGVRNSRDIGGYTTMDGKTVKQDMIIRGAELDGLTIPAYFMTEEGIQKSQDEFDFVYDFDLRGGHIFTGTYISRLGENVRHKFYGAPQYGEAFNRNYLPAMLDIFTDLANPDNYPMYMHCTYGNDRTGTIVFLLQGVLNMSKEDMLKEYHLSGFTTPEYADNDPTISVLTASLEIHEGDTIQEKIVSFLTQTVGVTEEQLQSIRDIMLE